MKWKHIHTRKEKNMKKITEPQKPTAFKGSELKATSWPRCVV